MEATASSTDSISDSPECQQSALLGPLTLWSRGSDPQARDSLLALLGSPACPASTAALCRLVLCALYRTNPSLFTADQRSSYAVAEESPVRCLPPAIVTEARETAKSVAVLGGPAALSALYLLACLVLDESPAEALRVLGHAAQRGHVASTFMLACLVHRGEVCSPNTAEAARLYERAAAAGHTLAMFNLAMMAYRGEGVLQDRTRAAGLYAMAANNGYARAQFNLGVLLFQGDGVPRDQPAALRLYRSASLQGHVGATYNLALACEQGACGPADPEEAVRLYRQAAAHGDTMSMVNLAAMLWEGRGAQRDRNTSVRLLDRAALEGNAAAQVTLGRMLESGLGVPKDKKLARALFEKAADQGNPEAAKIIAGKDRRHAVAEEPCEFEDDVEDGEGEASRGLIVGAVHKLSPGKSRHFMRL
eukprot:m51a1_g8036 hypothetical protein (420) ;mRNA; r:45985-47672